MSITKYLKERSPSINYDVAQQTALLGTACILQTFLTVLLQRMQSRPKLTLVHTNPPTTGRACSYLNAATPMNHRVPKVIVTQTSTNGYRASSHTEELLKIKQAIQIIQSRPVPSAKQHNIKEMQTTINELKTATTLTMSTLTASEQDIETYFGDSRRNKNNKWRKLRRTKINKTKEYKQQEQQMAKMMEFF